MEKKCTKCGLIKPLSDFYPDDRYKLGTKNHCAACCKAYMKALTTEQRRQYHISFKEKHPDRYKEQKSRGHKKYASKNPEKIKSYEVKRQESQAAMKKLIKDVCSIAKASDLLNITEKQFSRRTFTDSDFQAIKQFINENP